MKTFVVTIGMVFLAGTLVYAQDAAVPPVGGPDEETAVEMPMNTEDIALDIKTAPETVEGFVYDAKGERDPFLRLVDEHGVVYNYDQDIIKTDMNLGGILSGLGGNIAIVNNDVVSVGDMVGNYTVEGISTDTVILRKGQDELELKLKKEEWGHGY